VGLIIWPQISQITQITQIKEQKEQKKQFTTGASSAEMLKKLFDG